MRSVGGERSSSAEGHVLQNPGWKSSAKGPKEVAAPLAPPERLLGHVTAQRLSGLGLDVS